ncbi:MAG TPA: hypothetical protein VHA09_05990 [Nitrososphaera sp.]|nr:hypothetical protein [Nitrososphaera sp.]
MVLGCRGLCARLETIGGGKYSAYSLGYKRCSSCDIYIKWDSCRCPCCKLPLRVKKRTKQNNNNNGSDRGENIITQAHV